MLTIVVSGPQATGTTTLTMALGTAMSVPVFSRDPRCRRCRRPADPGRPAAGTRAEYMRNCIEVHKQRRRARLVEMLGGQDRPIP